MHEHVSTNLALPRISTLLKEISDQISKLLPLWDDEIARQSGLDEHHVGRLENVNYKYNKLSYV